MLSAGVAAAAGSCEISAVSAGCEDGSPRDYYLHWHWNCSAGCEALWDIEYKCCQGGAWQTIESNWDAPGSDTIAHYTWTPITLSTCSSDGFKFRLTIKVQSPCAPCVEAYPSGDCQWVSDCTVCPPK